MLHILWHNCLLHAHIFAFNYHFTRKKKISSIIYCKINICIEFSWWREKKGEKKKNGSTFRQNNEHFWIGIRFKSIHERNNRELLFGMASSFIRDMDWWQHWQLRSLLLQTKSNLICAYIDFVSIFILRLGIFYGNFFQQYTFFVFLTFFMHVFFLETIFFEFNSILKM